MPNPEAGCQTATDRGAPWEVVRADMQAAREPASPAAWPVRTRAAQVAVPDIGKLGQRRIEAASARLQPPPLDGAAACWCAHYLERAGFACLEPASGVDRAAATAVPAPGALPAALAACGQLPGADAAAALLYGARAAVLTLHHALTCGPKEP
ncbi:MAG: hypothetical protein ACPGUV_12340 [Polyangiales bacterium]